MSDTNEFGLVLNQHKDEILAGWIAELAASEVRRADLIGDSELREQCRQFIELLAPAAGSGDTSDFRAPEWQPVRKMLEQISDTRAQQGFTPREVALFVFSFKRPLFLAIGRQEGSTPQRLAEEVWRATELLDQLGLFTSEVYQETRNRIIERQQREVLELSTPVVKLWDGVVALPIIGTLDSARTQTVMEALLQTIVDTGSQIAILDITGVPTVDTLVAQHLLKTIAAAQLMGAECIISGIRPQIAQTMIHLGLDMRGVLTRATLADAFGLALSRLGKRVCKVEKIA